MERFAIGPYVQRVMSGAELGRRNKFPWRQASADDFELLFAWAHRHGQFDRLLPRLRARPRERDAAIAEIRAAWFLERLSFQITAWEPSATSQPGEFEITWPGTASIFVEVKGPTWESELSPGEQRGERKTQPRVVDGDGRYTGTQIEVRAAALKAMGKLASDRPSLLVVMDRLFRSPATELEPQDLVAILSDPSFDGLGGIYCIDANWLKEQGGVDYRTLFAVNPRAARTPWEIPLIATEVLAKSAAEMRG